MGIVITSGWIGLAVSSPIIGWVANQSSLQVALLMLPAMSLLMVLTSLLLRRYAPTASTAAGGEGRA
jgi:fucose permease